MCVGVCGTAPAYFHQWHFAIFQNFRWQLGAKNGSKKTVRHNTKHTRAHTCVLCVCAVGFWFMLPTLPAPCPCHCNGLTGECLFDRRQIETCNKMIKQLLATSRCSPSLCLSRSPTAATNYLVNFSVASLVFSFSQCTLHCVHISGIFHIHLPGVVVRWHAWKPYFA